MGREFRVNSYQDNWQENPQITTFADGSFLVIWDSYFNNFDDGPVTTYVAAQRYDANGQRIGGEQIIDAVDGASSQDARVATLRDGGYAIAFAYGDFDAILTSREEIYVSIYNADGTLRAAAIRVDTVPSNTALLPEVFATADGGFTVVFGVSRSTALFDQIYSQRFAADGTTIGGNTLVNVNVGEFDQAYARSATLANGWTITIWNSEGSFPTAGDLDSNEVRGTLTDATGAVIRADVSLSQNYGTVGSGSGAGYDVAALRDGGFVISHINYDFDLDLETPDTPYYTIFRFFDGAGNATSGKIVAFAGDDLPRATRVTQLETGEIVVIWSQDSLQRNEVGDDLYGRVFLADGRPISGVFEIGQDRGDFDEQAAPEIAALAGGGFVVTYTSETIDSDDEGIAARILGRGTTGDDTLGVDQTGLMAGLAGHDRLGGDGRANGLSDGGGNDLLSGLGGADRLDGGGGQDTLLGGLGNDRLAGGGGRDWLTGGTGADSFVFATAPGRPNLDRITDFRPGDRILLDDAVFAGLGGPGALSPAMFGVITAAGGRVDDTDRVIYDQRSGTLFHDRNGSEAGGRAVLAELDGRPVLTAADVFVI